MPIEPSQPSSPTVELIPTPRPEIGPEHNLWRRQIEAVLFGSSDELSFGRYRLLHRIGEGAMGNVYAADDEHLERKVAVKLIRPSSLDSAALQERTLREARALARLSHPNVVHVYEVGEIDGQLFVAMEFLAGPTLRAWLDAQRRPWREVLQAFAQAGEGLAAAHAHGIIHRDFKPHNAMFGADGRVRVLDFGLARVGVSEPPRVGAGPVEGLDRGLTLSGALLGTPAYMAPEQLAVRRASAQSDQFSFCVALFEALYGHRPFVGETLDELRAELTGGSDPVRPRDTDVPRWVHPVLQRGLAVDPDRRWPSMRELLAALRRDPQARRRRALAGALLTALMGAVSYAVAQPDQPMLDVCPDARDKLAVVWDQARAAAIEASVRAKYGARADEVLAIAMPQIDRYAEEWIAMRNEACRAHADGQESSNVFDLRTSCLDQRFASLEALVQMLANANAQQLDGIAQAAWSLPALERCADTTALLAAIAPPADTAMRARVLAHREALARAQVHEDAGQQELGLALVAEVLADGEALAYEPLLAEVYLRKGAIEMTMDPVQAERSLERALSAALATGHASVAAIASSKRAYVHGVSLGQHERAERDLPLIAALNRRVIDDVAIYAEYLTIVGAIYLSMQNGRDARPWLEEARDLHIARAQPMDQRGLSTLTNLVIVAMFERRYTDAYAMLADVVRESATVIPSTHHLHYNYALIRAHVLDGAGRPHAAMAEVLRCLTDLERVKSTPYMRAALFQLLGSYARDLGDLDASREHLLVALSLAAPGTDTIWMTAIHLMLTSAAAGDAKAVQTYHDQLAAELADQPLVIRVHATQQYSRALYQLGAAREAIAELEKARVMLSEPTTVADARVAADIAFDLGRAHRKLGHFDVAKAELVRAFSEFSTLYPVYGVGHADTLYELGELALERGFTDEAHTHLQTAISIYLETVEPDYSKLALARFALARTLTDASGIATIEALKLAEAATWGLRASGKHTDARMAEAWLTEHAGAPTTELAELEDR